MCDKFSVASFEVCLNVPLSLSITKENSLDPNKEDEWAGKHLKKGRKQTATYHFKH